MQTATNQNKTRKYRLVFRDDVQTDSPEYAYSRGFPFSIHSRSISPNLQLKQSISFLIKRMEKEMDTTTFSNTIQQYYLVVSILFFMNRMVLTELLNEEYELKNITQLLMQYYQSQYCIHGMTS